MVAINLEVARKVIQFVDAGLVKGVGVQEPGQMCVEAAVCAALGLPHGDDPQCVQANLRSYKIRLNDSAWSSNEARGKGLRKLAVAQLGSKGVLNGAAFRAKLAEKTIRVILPIALRAAADLHKDETHKAKLREAADFCAAEGSRKNAIAARGIARAAATYAANANANAANAANAAAYAATYAAAANAAYAAYAAYAAAYAANATRALRRDEILTMSADLCLEVLREMNAPGVALLDVILAEEAAAKP